MDYFDDISPSDLPRSRQTDTSAFRTPKVQSLQTLMATPRKPAEWVVDGLLIAGGISLLAGKPKSGKSTLSRHLAACVADGRDCLGRRVEQGTVLIMPLEDHPERFLEEFSLRNPTHDDAILIAQDVNTFVQLECIVKDHRPRLVIVDTLFRFARCRDPNSYIETLTALDPFLRLARTTGIHFLFLHHLSKRGRADVADQISGSVAIHGSMDASIILKVSGGRRTIESQNRYGSPIERTLLTFDPLTASFDLGTSDFEANCASIDTAIVTALRSADGATEDHLLSRVSGATTAKRKALRDLLRQGHIVRDGAGTRGNPFRYRLLEFST